MTSVIFQRIAHIFNHGSKEDVDAVEESLTAEILRLARRLDSVEKASFLAFMEAMVDDGADIRNALEIGNRVLTDAGRAPLWFFKNCAPVGDTK